MGSWPHKGRLAPAYARLGYDTLHLYDAVVFVVCRNDVTKFSVHVTELYVETVL